jgi:hypothetical protein
MRLDFGLGCTEYFLGVGGKRTKSWSAALKWRLRWYENNAMMYDNRLDNL